MPSKQAQTAARATALVAKRVDKRKNPVEPLSVENTDRKEDDEEEADDEEEEDDDDE